LCTLDQLLYHVDCMSLVHIITMHVCEHKQVGVRYLVYSYAILGLITTLITNALFCTISYVASQIVCFINQTFANFIILAQRQYVRI